MKELEVIKKILTVLYGEHDYDKDEAQCNPDKDWTGDEAAEIGGILLDYGYLPSNCLDMNPYDKIALIWQIDDVKSEFANQYVPGVWEDAMSDQAARYVLAQTKKNHDCTIGVSWEVIAAVIDSILWEIRSCSGFDGIRPRIDDAEAIRILEKLCEGHGDEPKCLDRELMKRLAEDAAKEKRRDDDRP